MVAVNVEDFFAQDPETTGYIPVVPEPPELELTQVDPEVFLNTCEVPIVEAVNRIIAYSGEDTLGSRVGRFVDWVNYSLRPALLVACLTGVLLFVLVAAGLLLVSPSDVVSGSASVVFSGGLFLSAAVVLWCLMSIDLMKD